TISVLYGVSGVCQAFVGILVDRYGGYRLMIFGVVTMSTAVLLMGFAPAYWVLLPLAALAAVGNSVFHPADLSILSEKVHPSRLGRAFGIHGFGGTCGYFISPIIVYYGVTSVVGWRMGLIVAGLIGLSAASLIWRYRSVLAMPRRDPNFGEERGGKADIGFYRDLVTSAPLMSAFFYFVMVAAALAGMQGFTVTALVERFDTPLHLAAAGVTAYFFGGAVGILLGGEIADRFRYPAFIASGGLAIAAVLMSTIGLFDMSITMIIGIMCSVGFWSGITQPSRDILVKEAAPERASGKTFGFVYSGLDLGGAVAPLYFGYLMDGGLYNEVFLVIGGLYALAIFTILQLRRGQRA
ncbi:MAG: MFS transporter, partial [Pseudomonadota bacterium]|nr:MFS transporter [Pseudomonadota bacterium]